MERRFLKGCAAAVVTAALLAVVATPALAKESQDYGLLTIQLIGAGGAERTFVAGSPEERQFATYLVSQLGMVTSAATVSASPPQLSEYYRIVVKQQPNFVPSLPWNSLSSVEFYFYPGRGQELAHLRCRVGPGSRPSHEFWLIAFPGVQSLIAPHLVGMPPIQANLPALPLEEEATNPLAGVGLAVLVLAALVIALTLINSGWWKRSGSQPATGRRLPSQGG